ncbi:chemotaxis protein CheW, partial [Alkalibacillus salilacus]|nr:chemotaxis signal transduction protein [Alkalibacillus salilacus]
METLQKCVVFELAGEDHAVSIQQVSSIEKIPTISTVPQSPTYIKGVA